MIDISLPPPNLILHDYDYMFFKGVTTSNYYQDNRDNPDIDLLSHIEEIDEHIQSIDKQLMAPLNWMNAEVKRFITVKDDKNEYHRHKFYPQYKANRVQKTVTPASILNDKTQVAIKVLKDIYKSRGCLYQPGIEADDLVGSGVSQSLTDTSYLVIGQDKDLRTLPNIYLYDTYKNTYTYTTIDDATYYTQYQMVVGDTSDGYPGIPGIGEAKFPKLFGNKALPWGEYIPIYTELCTIQKKDEFCRNNPYTYMALMYKLAHILHPGELLDNNTIIKYKYPFNYTDNYGCPMEK